MFFICSFDLCISSLVVCLFRSSVHFLFELFGYFLLLGFDILIWAVYFGVLYHMCILNYFLPVCTLSFYSLTRVIYRVDILGFNLKTFFFSFLAHFWFVFKKSSLMSKTPRFSPMLFCSCFVILNLTLRPMIQF